MTRSSIAVVIFSAGLPLAVLAQDACLSGASLVDCHLATADYLFKSCRTKVEWGILQDALPADTLKCVATAETDGKASYQRAATTLGKKPAALEAFKKFQARFLSAIGGIPPKPGETNRDWKRRLGKLEEDLDLAANEVKVEM